MDDASEEPEELGKRLQGLVAYLLEKGPVIENGDTIGEDDRAAIRAVHRPSVFGFDGEVMRLEYVPTTGGVATAAAVPAGRPDLFSQASPGKKARIVLAFLLVVGGVIPLSQAFSGSGSGGGMLLWVGAAMLGVGFVWLATELAVAFLDDPFRGSGSFRVKDEPGAIGPGPEELLGRWTARAMGDGGVFLPGVGSRPGLVVELVFERDTYRQTLGGEVMESGG